MDHREIDVGLGDFVDEVREHILDHEADNLHDLRVREAGRAHRCEVGVGHLSPGLGNLGRETGAAGRRSCVSTTVAGDLPWPPAN